MIYLIPGIAIVATFLIAPVETLFAIALLGAAGLVAMWLTDFMRR